ncbi:MAG: glycosyltransferase family 4 protein [Elusimicrobia bacterium]|nr:glycosyltransferase family 4 protein [Elusimicrobiota bacterium]
MAAEQKIKVVHVITQLELGGAQQNTLYTVKSLDRTRFEPVLVSGPGGILDQEARDIPQLKIHFIPSLVRPLHPLKDAIALAALIRVFREEKPDVVHTHSSKAGILGRVAAALIGVPLILHTYHGFGFHDRQFSWLRRMLLGIEWCAAKLSTRLIFVSRANLETAVRHGLTFPEKSVLIRSGVPLKNFPAKGIDPQKKKTELGVGMHKPLVVSVGNLKPQKNPEDFILLAKMVYEKNREIRFLFIGDGVLRARLEGNLLRYGLHGKCFFPGWRRDIPEILTASDVFVLTSLWEGLPRSLVEAMKSGLPSVCYSTDGIQDLIRDGENGYLISPGNVELMAKKLLFLLEHDSVRKQMGQKAAESIGPEFDIDGMVRQQEKLYQELAIRDPRSAIRRR